MPFFILYSIFIYEKTLTHSFLNGAVFASERLVKSLVQVMNW